MSLLCQRQRVTAGQVPGILPNVTLSRSNNAGSVHRGPLPGPPSADDGDPDHRVVHVGCFAGMGLLGV